MKLSKIITPALFMVISLTPVFTDGVTIIKDDSFKTVNASSGKILYSDFENKTAVIESPESPGSPVSLTQLEFWPIWETVFSSDGKKLYLVAGESSARDPKIIMEYDTETGAPNWSYTLRGDFVSSLSLSDDKLMAVSIHNDGVLLKFDLAKMEISAERLYESQCYQTAILRSGGFFVYGCDNYKEDKYSIKFLSPQLEVISGKSFPSGSYTIEYNPRKDIFAAVSHNQYLAPDTNVRLYDGDFNLVKTLTFNENPQCFIFSDDGKHLIVAAGYGVKSRIEVFTADGEEIEVIPVETDETYLRIADVYGNYGNLYVELGKSER